ncbi:MAG: DUF1566 domain-containing protein, partial [Verrucomicrobiota bacterium]
PTVSDAVWVTSTITDDGSVASAALTYTATTGTLATTTPYTETFGSTATPGGSTWTGTADNTWTVVGAPNPFKLMTSANYTTSSTACGMQFNGSKVMSASLTTSSAINAAATSGYVEFYVSTTSLGAAESWALQIDATGTGSSFVTRMSETGSAAGSTHTMTKYHYDLASTELIATLKIRFLFTGTAIAADTGRINLDQITVTVSTGSNSTATVAMLDDGAHGDGAAGDHLYGAQIPALSLGSLVSYYLTATDNAGQAAKSPTGAPTTTYAYTVAAVSSNTAPTVTSAAAASPATVTGTTTSLAALGADADTSESTLTYTWAATTMPSGATTPSIIANGSNAAKSTSATFNKAGPYTFMVTIADPGGLAVTSAVSVTVAQTLTAIAVTPATANLAAAATQSFSAVANDQFGTALTNQPIFTWTTTVTGGTISSSGLFTAPVISATGSATATSAAVIGNASVTVTSLSHPYTMAALPDTGQVASYSTITGEDADYTINPPNYKNNGDGTITDRITGLMWQQVDGGEMTWEQAVTYAASLSLGGHRDWRIAFATELYSIMDLGTINPAINTTYFTASAADYWWSADVAVDDATKVWVTNAGGGIGPHPKTETLSAGGSKRFHVRCV